MSGNALWLHRTGRPQMPKPASRRHLYSTLLGTLLSFPRKKGGWVTKNEGYFLLKIVPACWYGPWALEGNEREAGLGSIQIWIWGCQANIGSSQGTLMHSQGLLCCLCAQHKDSDCLILNYYRITLIRNDFYLQQKKPSAPHSSALVLPARHSVPTMKLLSHLWASTSTNGEQCMAEEGTYFLACLSPR